MFPATVSSPTIIVPVTTADGARSELIFTQTRDSPRQVLYWLPAMGVPAKHYLPLAEAFAAQGIAMVLHEWRGIGSSDRRAGKQCDWGYRELLEADLKGGMAEAKTRWPHARFWMGGHSLGGQLSCLYACLHPREVAGIVLIASGAPYWRCFPYRLLVRIAYAFATPLARWVGYLPGRSIGFGGNEARSVITDWSRSGRTGRYSARGMDVDFEARLGELQLPTLALRLRDDWLVPSASLQWLLDKMPNALHHTDVIAPEHLAGQRADHFAWMKAPHALALQLTEWMQRSDADTSSLNHARA